MMLMQIKLRVKHLLQSVLEHLPVQNKIFFESNPDFTDNTFALYEGMVKRDYQDKYKMIWYSHCEVCDINKIIPSKGLYCNEYTRWNRLKTLYHLVTSKYIISNQTLFNVKKKGQKKIYLTHGIPLKGTPLYSVSSNCDFCLATSKQTASLLAREFVIENHKMVPLGFPRNDALFEKIDLDKVFEKHYEKVVVWYPTYRQHKARNRFMTNQAIPLIDNVTELNWCAKEQDILIIVKPHPAQDVSFIKMVSLSNIKIIDDSFFERISANPYTFLASCDALITDYSSVYFDYLLCDKPIALIWSDIEDYKKFPGLIPDYGLYSSGVEIIYSILEFKTFLHNVASGIDLNKEQRKKLKDLIHEYGAGSTDRVINWMEKELDL